MSCRSSGTWRTRTITRNTSGPGAMGCALNGYADWVVCARWLAVVRL